MRLFKNAILTVLLTAGVLGHAQNTKRKLELPEFTRIYVNSNYTVHLKQTNTQEVTVDALTEIFEISELKVEDGTLLVNINREPDNPNKSIWAKIDDIKLNPTIDLYVSLKNIEELRVNGNGKIVSENSIASNNIQLGVSGGGNMDVDIKGEVVEAEVSGSGNLTLRGYGASLDLNLSGSGRFLGFECPFESAEVRVSGSGSADLNATTSLDALVLGSGSIRHKGDTKSVTRKVYGSGSINRAY